MKIFVVIRSMGEFSDRSEVIVGARRTEPGAIDLMSKQPKRIPQDWDIDGDFPQEAKYHYVETELED